MSVQTTSILSTWLGEYFDSQRARRTDEVCSLVETYLKVANFSLVSTASLDFQCLGGIIWSAESIVLVVFSSNVPFVNINL